jgi:hypothetical protein
MPLDNSESLTDPFPLSDTLEQVPDSSPLRVSLNTQLESGIPPARLREDRESLKVRERALSLTGGVDHLDLALVEVARTEANMGLLLRGLKHLENGAIAAREANTELMHELDALRTHLARSHDEEQAMRFRMGQLEQLLDVIRHETTRERAFLIEQQDLFLLEIMNDHERQLSELQRLARAAAARASGSAEMAELIAQRDQAREYATRCERERDLAWHELATGQGAPVSVPPATLRRSPAPPAMPSTETSSGFSKSGAAAIGSISLRAVQVPAPSLSAERPASGYSRPGSGDDSAD